jgi:hemoglobin
VTAPLFDRIGGDALRAVLTTFYDRVFADVMIGYLFAGADRQRLIEKEWELAARQLGAPVRYTGEPMREVHARHRIFDGQFARRQQLLRHALRDHGIDPEVAQAWLDHQEALRPQVVGGACA